MFTAGVACRSKCQAVTVGSKTITVLYFILYTLYFVLNVYTVQYTLYTVQSPKIPERLCSVKVNRACAIHFLKPIHPFVSVSVVWKYIFMKPNAVCESFSCSPALCPFPTDFVHSLSFLLFCIKPSSHFEGNRWWDLKKYLRLEVWGPLTSSWRPFGPPWLRPSGAQAVWPT